RVGRVGHAPRERGIRRLRPHRCAERENKEDGEGRDSAHTQPPEGLASLISGTLRKPQKGSGRYPFEPAPAISVWVQTVSETPGFRAGRTGGRRPRTPRDLSARAPSPRPAAAAGRILGETPPEAAGTMRWRPRGPSPRLRAAS